jgi:hypothetical protein
VRIDEQIKVLDRIGRERGQQYRVGLICSGLDMLTTNSLSWERLGRFRNLQVIIGIGLPGFKDFLYELRRRVSDYEVLLPKLFTARSNYAAWGHFDIRGLCLLQVLPSQTQEQPFSCTTAAAEGIVELDRHKLVAHAIDEIW